MIAAVGHDPSLLALIGTPYAVNFRCWDFVRTVFARKHHVDMPEHAAGVLHLKAAAAASGWRPCSGEPRADDIVVMRNTRGERHVGVVAWCNERLGVLHNDGWIDAEGKPHGAVCFDDFNALRHMGCSEFEYWRLQP